MAGKYNLARIPGWVITKKYGYGTMDTAAAILALGAGSAAVVRETEKAILVEWGNTELIAGACGGKFWVAKSLIKA